MTTGYKMRYQSVRVNTRGKADRIIKALKNQGRHAFYENFWDYRPGCEYYINYWPVKGVI